MTNRYDRDISLMLHTTPGMYAVSKLWMNSGVIAAADMTLEAITGQLGQRSNGIMFLCLSPEYILGAS